MDGWIWNAKSFDDLVDSSDFDELDAKLSKDLDSISARYFDKSVHVKEAEYSKERRMVSGRQITWMIYQHFKVSETNGAMLDRDEFLSVELKGDNVQ